MKLQFFFRLPGSRINSLIELAYAISHFHVFSFDGVRNRLYLLNGKFRRIKLFFTSLSNEVFVLILQVLFFL